MDRGNPVVVTVVISYGNDNDSLLSLSEHSQDALGRLEGDTGTKPPGGSTYDLSKMDPSSALSRLAAGPNSNAGAGHDPLTTGSPSSMMAHHQHLAGQRSMCDVGRSPTTPCGVNRMNSLPTDSSRMASGLAGDTKPRIWSLADVAKSEGHSPVRRSLSNMNVVAAAPNTLAQHPSPHTGQTPYSHPGYRSFQPWVNGAGAYATSAAGTSGSGLSYAGYSPSLTHHGLSSVGQMSGMTRNDLTPTNNAACVVAPTNYTSKLQNGLLDYDAEECM
ncbi:hypothetical protein NP493_96g03012 [Ridgeia piscesae]|uniref:Iroquois-class homeodomain protein domain-containing protein n=1 Tax=Ridgeia piscesae TaxID=27915 RepID=A0AAD9P8B9_RIDPI|nr:hypothetical protein NP493_96g03012 [Ridgeia piscesae]